MDFGFWRSLHEKAFTDDGFPRWGKPRGMSVERWVTMCELMRERQTMRRDRWSRLPWWQRLRYRVRGVTWATWPVPNEPRADHIILGVRNEAEKAEQLRAFLKKEASL